MKRRGEMRVERRRMKGRRGEVEISSQGNEGDRMAIIRRPEWGVLVLTSRLKYRKELTLKQSSNYTMSHEP
jgi:hypothetical protein